MTVSEHRSDNKQLPDSTKEQQSLVLGCFTNDTLNAAASSVSLANQENINPGGKSLLSRSTIQTSGSDVPCSFAF